jgi:hypothetical protein
MVVIKIGPVVGARSGICDAIFAGSHPRSKQSDFDNSDLIRPAASRIFVKIFDRCRFATRRKINYGQRLKRGLRGQSATPEFVRLFSSSRLDGRAA